MEEVKMEQNHFMLVHLPKEDHDEPNKNDLELQKEFTSTSQQSGASSRCYKGNNSNLIKLI